MAKDINKEEGKPPSTFKKQWIGPIIAAGIFLPSTIVLSVMMLPTAIAAIVDKNRPRALLTTVGLLNFSGATAAWISLIGEGHSYQASRETITDLDMLLTSYGMALLGFVTYAVVVPVVANLTIQTIDFERRKIEKQQEHLITLWGQDVSRQRRR